MRKVKLKSTKGKLTYDGLYYTGIATAWSINDIDVIIFSDSMGQLKKACAVVPLYNFDPTACKKVSMLESKKIKKMPTKRHNEKAR